MTDWYVYIIQAENGHLYTGITTSLKNRLQEHENGKKGARFFRITKAQKIVYVEKAPDRSLASKREYAIKQLTRNQKLALITLNPYQAL
jgi:putative endonuclease